MRRARSCAPCDHVAALRIRRAAAEDVAAIVEVEARPDYAPFINHWPAGRHAEALANPDFVYVVFEQCGVWAGYAILAGVTSPNRAVQLTRIALAQPGDGRGKQAMALLMREVFDGLGAHRFYLDLFEDNARAEHLYRSLGFRYEGTLREAERRGEKYLSLKVMSILEPEYRDQIA